MFLNNQIPAYQNQWKAKVVTQLKLGPETRAGSLVEDRHIMQFEDNTVWHVPKFLSKLTYFFLKNGGTLCANVTGEISFSYNLDQGGMELPADFRFTSSNPKLLEQIQKKTAAAAKTYEALRQEREGKKKDKERINFEKKKKFQKYYFCFPYNFVRIR